MSSSVAASAATRFSGKRGRAALQCAIEGQALVADETIARSVLALPPAKRRIRTFEVGDALIEADAYEHSVFLLLTGKVEVRIKGNVVAERVAGNQVGEMACIDEAAPRSATVRALEPTVALELDSVTFNELALRHPIIWQRVARDLGRRLRERGARERQANAKPQVFLGSSGEHLRVLEKIAAGLERPELDVRPWTKIFMPGTQTLDQLSQIAFHSDFAVLLLTGDDYTNSRGKRRASPRDNVVLELGLFAGRLSIQRVFVVAERNLKLPSDLDGLTHLPFRRGVRADHRESIERVTDTIRDRITELGVRFTPKEGERPGR